MNPIHEEKAGELTIKIYQDADPISPEENKDRDAFLVHYHPDFGVERDKIIVEDDLRAWYQGEKIGQEKTYHIFPVSAFIHGEIVLSLGNDPARGFDNQGWDTSHVGAVLCSKSEWPKRDRAFQAANSLISEWNNYLSCNAYGYKIEDADGKILDSCWGFYGDYDGKEYSALKEARSQAAYFNSEKYAQENGNKYAIEPIVK